MLFNPPIVVTFESYGQPVRSLDLIYLNGIPLRVMKVDNTMDPSKNIWWQKIECEWTQFSNPVSTENLLIGREKKGEDINDERIS